MYKSRQFTVIPNDVPNEMASILTQINNEKGSIVSVTQSSTDTDGYARVSVIVIYIITE
jgi:hypothetical protein